jgi:hypothetical protein
MTVKPILARFLPSDGQLIDMALARLDPELAGPMHRYMVIRRLAYSFMMALPAYFVGGLAQLFHLRFFYHLEIPLIFWIREPAMLVVTSWIAFEMFHVERTYRRFGL